MRNDISYGIYIYGWPVQQLLAMMGLTWLPPGVFFVVATAVTMPMAAASWFLVEKHAMKLKRRVQTEEPTQPDTSMRWVPSTASSRIASSAGEPGSGV